MTSFTLSITAHAVILAGAVLLPGRPLASLELPLSLDCVSLEPAVAARVAAPAPPPDRPAPPLAPAAPQPAPHSQPPERHAVPPPAPSIAAVPVTDNAVVAEPAPVISTAMAQPTVPAVMPPTPAMVDTAPLATPPAPPVEAVAATAAPSQPAPTTEPVVTAPKEVYDTLSTGDYSRICGHLRRAMVYPHRARQQGWQGKVLVAFRLQTDGNVTDVQVAESSGHQLLDDSAVATIHKAAPFPALGREFRLLCPIAYKLH